MKISVLGDGRELSSLGNADVVLVCVDAGALAHSCERLGRALAGHEGAPVIAIGSTVLPGSTREVLIPLLEKFSGKRAGEDFGVCVEAHSLRHGTVIGELNRASGDVLAALYARKPGRLVRTELETAEMFRHADNAWNALRAGFANEIGTLCKAHGVDAHALLEMLSPGDLTPGSPFGGASALEELLLRAANVQAPVPILEAVPQSHAVQLERAVQAVAKKGRRQVGVLGLSPSCTHIAERLLAQGFELHLGSVDEVLARAETLVIVSASPEFADLPRRLREGQTIIDLVRACDSRPIVGLYEGLCW